MKRIRRRWIYLMIVVLAFAARSTRAADPIPTTDPAPQPVDKWGFTLFNPTPADQMRNMDTNRPDHTNTPHTIDAGHLQIETGVVDYAYYRNTYHGVNLRSDTFGFAQFAFRLGVLNDLEMDAVINAEDLQRTTNYTAQQTTRQNGFGDTVLGANLNLWGNEGSDANWTTGLGVQAQVKIPTARENLGNGHAEAYVGVPFVINLPGSFHLGLQTTVSWERNTSNDGEVTGWQNSAALDRVLFDKFDVYLEYWSHLSTEHHQEAQQTIDVGVTVPIGDNLVLDTGVNFGLNRASPTVEGLMGFSVRF